MRKLNLLFIAVALFAFIACQGTGQKAEAPEAAVEEVIEAAAVEADSAAVDATEETTESHEGHAH